MNLCGGLQIFPRRRTRCDQILEVGIDDDLVVDVLGREMSLARFPGGEYEGDAAEHEQRGSAQDEKVAVRPTDKVERTLGSCIGWVGFWVGFWEGILGAGFSLILLPPRPGTVTAPWHAGQAKWDCPASATWVAGSISI